MGDTWWSYVELREKVHSHQRCTGGPVSPDPHQHWALSLVFAFAILVGVCDITLPSERVFPEGRLMWNSFPWLTCPL